MNILFEFLTVSVKTGAGEYHRRVFFKLLDKIQQSTDTKIYALYDSTQGIAYEDLRPETLVLHRNVNFVDCANKPIDKIIQELNISVFFIACSQYLRNHSEIERIHCTTICVTHDIAIEEFEKNKLLTYFQLSDPANSRPLHLPFLRKCLIQLLPKYFSNLDRFTVNYLINQTNDRHILNLNQLKHIIGLYRNNPKTILVTVSEYSKMSLMYNYGLTPKDICVMYSPERIMPLTDRVDNHTLSAIIANKKRYYLMTSAYIMQKNPHKVLNAFRVFQQRNPESFIVTIGYGKSLYDNHIDITFLSDSDLVNAYKHCYALIYPSFFEGFGYPPLECMRFAKPVLSSNTSSIREVLGDAPLYFSPFYESDIFAALCSLTQDNYSDYCKKSLARYGIIHKQQEKHLDDLVDMILSGK